MAKKLKKTKSQAGTVAPKSVAVLYHLDEGAERGDAVRAVLAEQDVRVKTVSEEQIGNPVGAVVGLKGFRMMSKPFEGDVPEGEFLLLANFTNAQLNALLNAMREADCSVGCKAQVTQHNRMWPFVTLVNEVSQEHAELTGSDN